MAYYDRILVLDAGRVLEYDTPLALFDRPGSAFRSLCDKKVCPYQNCEEESADIGCLQRLSRQELLRIRNETR